MEWTPLTREALEEMISQGLERMDDVVQDAWEGMRIEPEKWQCSPWGDQGGGFWAVAVKDGHVVWYNDIEDGFNASRFTQRGAIDEYACNQASFDEFLLALPGASGAENWLGELPADAVPPELQSGGTIVRRQTTYWEVRSTRGTLWRLHFRSKAEAIFVESRFSNMELLHEHPLLKQYLEPWAQLFFTGTSFDAAAVEKVLADRVAALSDGWRTLADYLNSAADLRKGYGLLMRGPKSLVDIAATVLAEMGISASILDGAALLEHPHALIMDRNAIVAESFRFERRSAA